LKSERARRYYRESAPLLDLIQPESRPSLWALIAIYSRLLDRVAESHYDVLMRRISLGRRFERPHGSTSPAAADTARRSASRCSKAGCP
jgi:hypothetical protein